MEILCILYIPKFESGLCQTLCECEVFDLYVHLNFLFLSAWNTLWPQEKKRQRAFFLFGLALILQLDIEGIRTFFRTFFCLPDWYGLFSLIYVVDVLEFAQLLVLAIQIMFQSYMFLKSYLGLSCRKPKKCLKS